MRKTSEKEGCVAPAVNTVNTKHVNNVNNSPCEKRTYVEASRKMRSEGGKVLKSTMIGRFPELF
jgi:hypothetical protein